MVAILMSDDTEDEIIIIGDPLDPAEFAESATISQQDIDDAIDFWDETATDLFVGALEWNA